MTRNRKPTSPNIPGSSSTTLRFVSLALVFLTMIALGAVTYFTERGILRSRDWVIHTYEVRYQLKQLSMQIMRAHANATTYLLTRDRNRLAPSREQSDLANGTVDALVKLTSDNPRQTERLQRLKTMMKENAALIEAPPDFDAGRVQLSAGERRRQEDIGDQEQQIDTVVQSMQDDEESLLDQRRKAWDHLFKRNVLMLGIAFTVVVLMLAYNFRILVVEVAETRSTEKRVRDNAESYRVMSARILELQDSERRRFARELHDSVGQYLAGLKINLNQLESGDRIDPQKLIQETIEMTDCAIQEVRTISHLLHPPLLEELGFLPAARWYVDEYGKRSQVTVSLHVDEPIERLPREVEIALFRVLQEALTNVYRHASAQTVNVRILCRDENVTLSVRDDGKGIPREILARFSGGAAAGIGLAGMRERLAEIGGQLNVESSRIGTVVEALIPTTAFRSTDNDPARAA